MEHKWNNKCFLAKRIHQLHLCYSRVFFCFWQNQNVVVIIVLPSMSTISCKQWWTIWILISRPLAHLFLYVDPLQRGERFKCRFDNDMKKLSDPQTDSSLFNPPLIPLLPCPFIIITSHFLSPPLRHTSQRSHHGTNHTPVGRAVLHIFLHKHTCAVCHVSMSRRD